MTLTLQRGEIYSSETGYWNIVECHVPHQFDLSGLIAVAFNRPQIGAASIDRDAENRTSASVGKFDLHVPKLDAFPQGLARFFAQAGLDGMIALAQKFHQLIHA